MLLYLNTLHRASTVGRILIHTKSCQLSSVAHLSDDVIVSISDVSRKVKVATHPEYIPRKYLLKKPNQETLKNLRWMLQKDVLGQDIFLTGGPGPRRRNLALTFLELTGREVEFIALSRDTTEADLKQRREIENGTARYHDQSAVRAAKDGRILILEGVEKAERNVLPILNNLLENREMHLEDGRFLMSASRYDKLLKENSQEELDKWKLVRVSEDFRVIALGLPSPLYPGHPLDPPLRSRFQARHITPPSYKEQIEVMKTLAPNYDPGKLSQLLSCCYALVSKEARALGLPDFPLDSLPTAASILNTCPKLSAFSIFYKLYPYKLFLGKEGITAVEDILNTFGVLDNKNELKDGKIEIEKKENSCLVTLTNNIMQTSFNVPRGTEDPIDDSSYVKTNYQNDVLMDILLSQASSDYCIVGPKGCGKSTVIKKLANDLGYEVEPILLYQDMTSRDLIQQRTTTPSGDTVWKDSPLITAALSGKLAILDGIHRVHSSTLAVIHRLIHDREIQLHNGKRLMGAQRYDQVKLECKKTDEDMRASGILRIHPSFRIAALAEPPVVNTPSGQWINSELLSLFTFHEMRPLAKAEEIHIIKSKHGVPNAALGKIIDLAHVLRSSKDPTLQSLAGSLSTRQLLRIASRMQKFPSDDAYDAIHRACLARFLPAVAKQALEDCMKKLGIEPSKLAIDENIKCTVNSESVTIGATTINRYKTAALTKVPDILFYDVPQHLVLLERLLQDFILGQNILLVGNQGVGKNKIVDRLLQLLNRPREYIQLHRDTTVQTLTLQPMVQDGIVIYEDSPLVRAVKLGHVLVIDEADKAPTHVTCILKTLAGNGEMILSDGRRIVPLLKSHKKDSIPIHPDFRIIVLANRPGFPFLGNDFFAAVGDLFSTHSVDNPSMTNEVSLLKQYGPDVDDKIIQKLVRAFSELRAMSDQGQVSYPYSTREVVNIVKHLQKFPNEPLASVVRNVFDFDRYTSEVFDVLVNVLHKNGIPLGTNSNNIALAKELSLPELRFGGTWMISKDTETISAQERPIKFKAACQLRRETDRLDRVEARSAWFTEMHSYWSIPRNEASFVAALAVSKGSKSDGSDDKIHVLTANPACISTMTASGDTVERHDIQSLLGRGMTGHSRFEMASDNLDNLWIHEELSNTFFVVDLVKSTAQVLQRSSFFETAGDKLNQTFRNKSAYWKLKLDLIPSDNQAVFYTPDRNEIDVINLENRKAYSMSLPLDIASITLLSARKWLIQSVSKQLFMLEKSEETSPFPNVLREVLEKREAVQTVDTITNCSKTSLDKTILSRALNQSIDSPNRLLATDFSYASIVVGLPELLSPNELYYWPRSHRIKSSLAVVTENGQIIRALASDKVPESTIDRELNAFTNCLEVVDTANHKVRYLPIPTTKTTAQLDWLYRGPAVYIAATSNGRVVSVDVTGRVIFWETSSWQLEKSLNEWRKMVDTEGERLQITKERFSGLDTTSPKHGKVDEENNPHVGGNTWAGGTGGRDTAGLGGKGGPYRLDAGHTVHQLSDDEKNSVPEHVKKAAREMGQRVFQQRLKDIRMSEYDHQLYSQFSDSVCKQVKSLRVILDSLQAKSNERQWLRHQTSGELDDAKLIEGITGEKTIYRRRADKEPEIGAPQLKPKRLKLVVDVSGSMYRFNGYDGRLDRQLEACVMVMEGFFGYEGKIQYDIVGHSGEEYDISFVDADRPPTDNKQRLEVVKTMHAHSQFCQSGDHTLEATQHAIATLAKEESDESIVVVLSDANLERYGIPPQKFGQLLTSCPDVNAYAIFIGSLGDQAARVMQKMPSGRAFVCMDLKKIPQILQQIFAASVLRCN